MFLKAEVSVLVTLVALLSGLVGDVASQSIVASGGTFPRNVYNTWKLVYPITQLKRAPTLKITYNAVGSGAAKIALNNKTVDYAASDSSLSATEIADSGGLMRTIPMLVGSLCLIFYVPELASPQTLTLTREQAVGIFNGTLTKWNDPSLVALNPLLATVNQNITAVVRGDSSGSTEILTGALSAMSPGWKKTYGVFSKPATWTNSTLWPTDSIKTTTSGDVGMVITVLSKAYSIGYLDQPTAKAYSAQYATIINRAGQFTLPNAVSVASAVADFQSNFATVSLSNYNTVIADGNGTDSYPFVAFTYVVMTIGYPTSCTQQYEVVRYAYWGLKYAEAADLAVKNFFVTVNPTMQAIGVSILKNMTCGGAVILDKVLSDIEHEALDLRHETFVIGISTISAMIAVCLVFAAVRFTQKKNANKLDLSSGMKGFVSVTSMYPASTHSLVDKLERDFKIDCIVFGIVMVIEVVSLALDWEAYIELPDDALLTMGYLVIVCIGTLLCGTFLLQRAYVLNWRWSVITKPVIETTGNRAIAKLTVELADLKNDLIWLSSKIITVFIREVPMLVVGFLIIASNTNIPLIYAVSYGITAACFGFKAISIGHYFSEMDKYAKGLQIKALLEERLAQTGSLDDISVVSLFVNRTGDDNISIDNTDGSSVKYTTVRRGSTATFRSITKERGINE